MNSKSILPVIISCVVPLVGCSSELSPVSPTRTNVPQGASAASQQSNETVERSIRGECTTQFSPIEPNAAGACSVFAQQPSAFIQIAGACRVSHLGRTQVSAVQQLLFLLDSDGQVVVQNGQPVATALRNCATMTSASGDVVHHTTTGVLTPGATASQVEFTGNMTFTGGSGRFANASGTAAYSGGADVIANTGGFSLEGVIAY
jgi:hypothetical protein